MAMYELDGNHLLPVRLGRSADADTRARSLAALQRQIVEVLRRPLFPLEWGRVTGGESLTALDATGQVVLVEVLQSLSAAEVMAAMARLTATAALGRRELAGRYAGGLVSFREDWNEFREAMPAQVEAGPRLTLVTAALAPEVRSSLSVLVGSGVELYEVDVRVVDEARVVVVVEQIVDGSLDAEGPLLVARAPRPSLTGPEQRTGQEAAPGASAPRAARPKADPVTGPIEIVMPRGSDGAPHRRRDAASGAGRRSGARGAAGMRRTPQSSGTEEGAAPEGAPQPPSQAARSEAAERDSSSPGAPGRASRAGGRSDEAPGGTKRAAHGAGPTGEESAASRQSRPVGSGGAEPARRGSSGRSAHAAVSARREAVVRRGVHASDAVGGPETGGSGSEPTQAGGPPDAQAPSASSGTTQEIPAAGAGQADGPAHGGPAAAQADPSPAVPQAPPRLTRSSLRTGAGGASTQETGSSWAAGGGPAAAAIPPSRGSAKDEDDLVAIASSFDRPQRIIWQGLRRGIYHEAQLSAAGIITLADGRKFTDPTSAANAAQNVTDADGWRVWRLGLRGPHLSELRERLSQDRSGS
ncbi:restriction system modified-DNA reader domain-containing protein [Actinomyces capricornis]|uniref:RAMA domain-containing protein n=1 Tax=Actinomyces capricornis TaxID=2755559 RepID=A0ABM7UBL7_9ACTO|nr:hypothetical protein [Actinomyces capricornis]BDA64711.1 hypothetical protein MANAM107_15450 [Actinomyces capricornis]